MPDAAYKSSPLIRGIANLPDRLRETALYGAALVATRKWLRRHPRTARSGWFFLLYRHVGDFEFLALAQADDQQTFALGRALEQYERGILDRAALRQWIGREQSNLTRK